MAVNLAQMQCSINLALSLVTRFRKKFLDLMMLSVSGIHHPSVSVVLHMEKIHLLDMLMAKTDNLSDNMHHFQKRLLLSYQNSSTSIEVFAILKLGRCKRVLKPQYNNCFSTVPRQLPRYARFTLGSLTIKVWFGWRSHFSAAVNIVVHCLKQTFDQ